MKQHKICRVDGLLYVEPVIAQSSPKRSNTRTIGDGPTNFKTQLSQSPEWAPSPYFGHTNGKAFSLDRFHLHQPLCMAGLPCQ
ncbi:hypothetical protein TNCV_1065401 [Trichonephila clavipes]|nr:hypothetical protein TNCV_1065401 [Trichonephila clavipes]